MKRFAFIFGLLLTAYCLVPTAVHGQGNATIRRVVIVPASCDVTGVTTAPMVWKIAGANPGLYTCIAGVYVYQTNTFGSGLTAKTMLFASAAPAAITSTAAPTNGQILIGSTGNIPALGTLTGTANETLITNGSGSIILGLAASLIHQGGTNFILTDTSDATKRFNFAVSSVTAGQTRVVTVPDANTSLPISSQILTFAGPTAARTITLPDANFTIPKVYHALLTQTGVSAPVATVLANTLGDTVVLARSSTGIYTLTCTTCFTSNKTSVIVGAPSQGGASFVLFRTALTSTSVITLTTLDVDLPGPTIGVGDALLLSDSIKIEVYP